MLDRSNTCVLIFNMQVDMIPLISNSAQILQNNVWLIDFAADLGIPTIIFKHKKLGEFPQRLLDVSKKSHFIEKEFFDCTLENDFRRHLDEISVENVVLAGAETHVCVYQSAIGLQRLNKRPYILIDSTSSRHRGDHDLAINRFNHHEMEVISQEMLFFEMVKNSEEAEYHGLAMKFLDGRYMK